MDQINQLEPTMQGLSDAELKSKTPHFRERLDDGELLDDLLPEAFAVVREAAIRTLGERHYDVQLMGGIVLHEGKIAEMKTGEGKTLASTLAVYLNALTGKGVHVATVNDYLAQRDAEWMGQIYNFLGLSVGLAISGLPHDLKKLGYKSDITYGVHSEFGFDYLWDNKGSALEEKVQRGPHYAIVDEVDSEWVGTYLDTANMMAYGYPEHWIRELGNRIKRVHFKDFKRREHRFVNLLDGDTDWPTVMRELRAIGYDEYVIHEVGGDRETQIDIAKRMRQIVAM